MIDDFDPTNPPADAPEVAGDDTATPSQQSGKVDGRVTFMQTDPRMIAQRGRFRLDKAGNPRPGGKPKSLPGFRKHCREDAEKVRKEIMRRIDADSQGTIPIKELVQAFTELSDRGGFVKPKDESDLDMAKARLVLAAMALKELSEESRKALLEAVNGE